MVRSISVTTAIRIAVKTENGGREKQGEVRGVQVDFDLLSAIVGRYHTTQC